jgi:hypothetical protein
MNLLFRQLTIRLPGLEEVFLTFMIVSWALSIYEVNQTMLK